MKGQLFFSFFIAAAFLATAKAQIELGDDKTKIQCTVDALCSEQFGNSSICDFGFCDCINGSNFNVEAGKCVEEIVTFRSGQNKCLSDRDCTMEDSVCRYGECKCPENFIQSEDSTKCLQLANEVGWGCEEDIQCTTKLNRTTECRDFICVCKPGTTINNMGSCVEAKGLEAFCSSDDVCTTVNSMCQQGLCACKEGFVADAMSKNCLEVAQGFKSPCQESIQCTQTFGQHAVCSKNRECICTANHHFSDLRCWEDRGLTERCDRPDECYIAEDGANQKLQCTAGQCVCKPEYVADLSTLRCSGATAATISGFSFALLALLLLV